MIEAGGERVWLFIYPQARFRLRRKAKARRAISTGDEIKDGDGV